MSQESGILKATLRASDELIPFMRSTRLRHYHPYFPICKASTALRNHYPTYFNQCVRFISYRGFNDSSSALVFGTYLLDGHTVAGDTRRYGMVEYLNHDSSHETMPFSLTSLHHHRRLMKPRNSNACTATFRCVKPRRRHRDSTYPLFVLSAIYQHLDPAQLLFSRRSLHHVFRWSITLWRDCQVAILRTLAKLAESTYPRNVSAWILYLPLGILQPGHIFPRATSILLSIHSCDQLKRPAYTLASSPCHRSSETFFGERSAQAQRLDAHVPIRMASLFDSNECNRTGIRLS